MGLVGGSGAETSTDNSPLIFRNLNFKATKADIFELLKPIGVVKKLRMSKAASSCKGEAQPAKYFI